LASFFAPKPVSANSEIFWVKQQKQSPVVLALFHFDAIGSAEDAIEELEDVLSDDGPLPGTASGLKTHGSGNLKRLGSVRDIATGHFGGAVSLDANASLRLERLSLNEVSKRLPGPPPPQALSVDFWLRPAQQRNRSTVLQMPSGRKSALILQGNANGQVALQFESKQLLVHPSTLPVTEWTHVALVIERHGGKAKISLSLNGHMAQVENIPLPPLPSLLRPAIELGRGYEGDIDELRVSRIARTFYPLQLNLVQDAQTAETLPNGPPWFAQPGPDLLAMTFDKNLKFVSPRKRRLTSKASHTKFQQGVRDRAIDLSTANQMKVHIAGHDLWPHDQGAVALWFRPVDWDNQRIGNFFGTNLKRDRLIGFSKKDDQPYQSVHAVTVVHGRPAKDGGKAWVHIHPGTWTHVVINRGGPDAGIYLNGQPQPQPHITVTGAVVGRKNHKEWLKIRKPDDDGGYGLSFAPSNTLIDDLEVYGRSLSGREIYNAWARYRKDADQLLTPLPLIEAVPDYRFYDQTLHVAIKVLPVKGVMPDQVRLRIVSDVSDEELSPEQTARVEEDGTCQFTVSRAFDFGKYHMKLASSAGSKELTQSDIVWHYEQPPWWRNDLGKQEIIPPPWTPIQHEGNRFSVWGRTVELSSSGLPDQIDSADQPILAEPIQVSYSTGGKAGTLEPKEQLKWKDVSGQLAKWEGALSGNGLSAQVTGSAEYDGLMRFDVTLKPQDQETIQLEKLTVDVPIQETFASQLIVNGGGFNFRRSWDVRMLAPNKGEVWNSRTSKPKMLKGVAVGHFCPIVWIGDDHRGLCFYSENDQGWTPRNDADSQTIHRVDGSIIYRMHVVTEPVQITQVGRTFHFMIHPTPTRPLPQDWRTFNLGRPGQSLAFYDLVDTFSGMALTDPADQPGGAEDFALEPHSWEDAAIIAERIREKFGRENPVLLYIDASWPKLGPTMNPMRHTLWHGSGRITWSREVEDYYVWIVNEYLKRGLIDGLYIDDVSMTRTRALYGTAYDLPDGTRQYGFNTMGFRRFLQRLNVLFYQRQMPARIVAHMTWCFEIPALTFVESALNGEDRVIPPNADATFIDRWRQDEIRIMSGPKFGFVPLWIPEIKTDTVSARLLKAWVHRQSRAMHALCLPHDLWYLFGYPTTNTIEPALIDFGFRDSTVRHIGPHESAARVTPSDQVLVSFHVIQQRAMMMVSNLSKEDRQVSVTIDPEVVFGRSAKTFTWRDIDPSLHPPASKVATKAQISKELSGDVALSTGEQDITGDFQLEDPKEMSSQRYRLKSSGTTVQMHVRGHDYRLIQVTTGPN